MTTERRTSVILENDEANVTISGNGKIWVRLKRMSHMVPIVPPACADLVKGGMYPGEFSAFEEFEEFVEALLQIRAMVRTELALAVMAGKNPKATA